LSAILSISSMQMMPRAGLLDVAAAGGTAPDDALDTSRHRRIGSGGRPRFANDSSFSRCVWARSVLPSRWGDEQDVAHFWSLDVARLRGGPMRLSCCRTPRHRPLRALTEPRLVQILHDRARGGYSGVGRLFLGKDVVARVTHWSQRPTRGARDELAPPRPLLAEEACNGNLAILFKSYMFPAASNSGGPSMRPRRGGAGKLGREGAVGSSSMVSVVVICAEPEVLGVAPSITTIRIWGCASRSGVSIWGPRPNRKPPR